jgi:hypothetical protein
MKPKLSLEEFADWCAKQPAGKTYDFGDYVSCACGQYAAGIGVDAFIWFIKMIDDHEAGRANVWIKANSIAYEKPHTFGALAARLCAVQS